MFPIRLILRVCALLCVAIAFAARPAVAVDAAVTSPNLRYYYPVKPADPAQTIETDVVVYGGTSGGVTAAVQATRMGKKAVLVEFGKHIGGLTSGGLSATDGGSAAAGLAREFYVKIGRQSGFLPAEAEKAYRDMLREAGVPVYTEHRLLAAKKDGNRITEIRTDTGNVFRGRMFIDATYEGDLFAAAGATYHVGREANSVYGETINGIYHPAAHNFTKPVDPYVVEGDPTSGLLWGITGEGLGTEGDGDRRVQAYNFRMYLARGGLPFPKPPDYDAKKYELLLRYIKLGGGPGVYPHNGDNNNQGGFSTDNIGRNYEWPDGPGRGDVSIPKDEAYFRKLYEIREWIYQDHVSYQQGLVWFVANDPRVPQPIRDTMKPWGLTPHSFQETGGWPHALYVREGRRLVSDFVMTEHHCRGTSVVEDSIGLAQYTMDSHNVQRVVLADPKTGRKVVKNEGDVQVRIPGPYPVAYRAIVPKEAEVANLLVPVCLSSSHIAYGSIRMEPVFMVLGQSAATAAAMAIDEKVSVQKVQYGKLRERLLADKQMLEWTGPRNPVAGGGPGAPAIDPAKLPGLVVDDKDATFTGDWKPGSGTGIGAGYVHDGDAEKGKMSAKFVVPIKTAGEYEVRLAYTAHGNRATNVPVTVSGFAGGEPKTVKVNQRKPPPIDQRFVSLGTFRFDAESSATVEVSNADTDGHVVVDAVQVVAK